ncbi:MAG TPA: helix-turn-helix transcriptional regulator, partial [Pseudonocardiaceae bacterium]|nr:helix-turn-helix transcriptional regulator [Pseudonocardiaceae bacterium]
MSERISPTVRWRKVARALRRWRHEAGLRLEDICAPLDWATSKLSRMERAEQMIGPAEVIALATIYGIGEQERDRYVALALQSRQKGWWTTYRGGDAIPEDFEEFVGLESEASRMRSYEDVVVTGLLQTEAYAAALVRAWLPRVSDHAVEERVRLRMARQDRLHEGAPLRLDCVLTEAALRQQVGGPGVMREQLRHLLDMTELSHVSVQVMPFAAGAYPAQNCPFRLLSFPDPEDHDVACVDYLSGTLYVEDAEDV